MDYAGVVSAEVSCDMITETCGCAVALGNLGENKPHGFDGAKQPAGNKGRAMHSLPSTDGMREAIKTNNINEPELAMRPAR